MTKIIYFTYQWALISCCCCLLSLTNATPIAVQKTLGFGVGFSAGLGVNKGLFHGGGLYKNGYGHTYNHGYYGHLHGPPLTPLYSGYNTHPHIYNYPHYNNQRYPYGNIYGPGYGHQLGNHYTHHQAHHEVFNQGYGHGNFYG